jgi:hypothetical protein
VLLAKVATTKYGVKLGHKTPEVVVEAVAAASESCEIRVADDDERAQWSDNI